MPADVEPSLPPVPAGADAPVPPLDQGLTGTDAATEEALKIRPSWYIPPDSHIRKCAMQAIAMRLAGMEDAEIAQTFKVTVKTLQSWIYRAGKNGWLKLDVPAERLDYEIMHRVVDNLEQALGDEERMNTGMKVRHAAALKIAEGSLFKRYDQQIQGPQQQTIVAVKIEMPEGGAGTMREGTVGGTPAFIDVEASDGGKV